MRTLLKTVLVSIGLISTAALAQTPPPPDGLWHGNAALGLSASHGNSQSTSVNLSGVGAVETTADKLTIYGNALRTSNSNAKPSVSADYYRLGGRYDRNITDRLYGFGGLEFEKDGVAGLKLRSSINAGIGYKVIRSADMTFDVFGGIGYSRQEMTSGTTSGAQLLLGEESTHKLSATSSFRQRLVIYPGQNDLGTRAVWDLGLATQLAGNLTLNAGYNLRYWNKAAAPAKNTDGLFVVGVGYKF